MGIKSNCLVFASTAALPVGECLNFRVALGLQNDPSEIPPKDIKNFVSKGEFFEWLTGRDEDEAVKCMPGTDEAGKCVYKFAQKILVDALSGFVGAGHVQPAEALENPEQFADAIAGHITRAVENIFEPTAVEEPEIHKRPTLFQSPFERQFWEARTAKSFLKEAKNVIQGKIIEKANALDERAKNMKQDILANIIERVTGGKSIDALFQEDLTPDHALLYTLYYEQQNGQGSDLREKTIKVFTKAALFGVVSGTILNIVESLFVKALKEGVTLESAAQGLMKQGDKIHKGAALLGMIGALKAVMTGAATSIEGVKIGEVDVSQLLLPIFGASFAAVTHPLYARAHLMKLGLAANVEKNAVDAILAQKNKLLSAETLNAGLVGNMGKEAISLPTSVAVSSFVSSVAPGIPLLPEVTGSVFGVLMAAPLERHRRISMAGGAPGSPGLPQNADLQKIFHEYQEVLKTARDGNFRQAVEAFTKISALKRAMPRAAGTAMLTFICGALANDLLQKV